MPALPVDPAPIIITASRSPEPATSSSASFVVIDQQQIERSGEPLIASLLRLTPSTAVTVQGPRGSLAEVRMRGAESNHVLLFMDGIKLNDPAAGDIPRFELLNADLASRIEVLRGPQSALWGSDAIGGVVAVNGFDDPTGYGASAEAGSFGSRRASGSFGHHAKGSTIAGAIGWQRADGIDSFGAQGGDRDGYANLSGRVRGTVDAGLATIGASALSLRGRSEFDGYDPLTGIHQDTLDSSRGRLSAGRVWADFGSARSPWSGQLSVSVLGSRNRNLLDGDYQNSTRGTRRTFGAQLERRLTTGPIEHRLIVAVDSERETFAARDTAFGGFSRQDRDRSHHGLIAEWRGNGRGVSADVAVRRDIFNRFTDTTSLRAVARVDLTPELAMRAAYADGIAQPTFFELYGFFPSVFVGNSSLKPESSSGFELGMTYRSGPFDASITAYRQSLRDEIVTVYDPDTFIATAENLDRHSRRRGLEVEGGWSPSPAFRLSANYAYLMATQPDDAGSAKVIELRRPRHSAALAADGTSGQFTFGGSIAYVGKHRDVRDSFPYDIVTLDRYWLANARIAYRLKDRVELYVRGTNLLDQNYQDSAGYRTEGRGLFAGLRFSAG